MGKLREAATAIQETTGASLTGALYVIRNPVSQTPHLKKQPRSWIMRLRAIMRKFLFLSFVLLTQGCATGRFVGAVLEGAGKGPSNPRPKPTEAAQTQQPQNCLTTVTGNTALSSCY